MSKGKPFASILLAMTFLAGIVAPVPECFVTRLACPFSARAMACPEHPAAAHRANAQAACCSTPRETGGAGSAHALADHKPWKTPYVPELEIVPVPAVCAAIPPALFHKALLPGKAFFVPAALPGRGMPEPIPILLRENSLLI